MTAARTLAANIAAGLNANRATNKFHASATWWLDPDRSEHSYGGTHFDDAQLVKVRRFGPDPTVVVVTDCPREPSVLVQARRDVFEEVRTIAQKSASKLNLDVEVEKKGSSFFF